MATIKRKILFYEVSGKGTDTQGNDAPIAIADVLDHIGGLPPVAPGPGVASRYMAWNDGDELLLEMTKNTGNKRTGIFAQKKYNGLGRIEHAGNYRDLQLAAGEGLAQLRHFVYWADRGLLGIEVNGRYPGMTAFSRYLVSKAGHAVGLKDVDFVVRLAPDPFDRLQRAERISTATIGVRRANIDVVNEFSTDAGKAFKAADEATNANELRMEFRLGDRKKGATLELDFLDKAKQAVAKPETRDKLTALQASVTDEEWGTTRVIDLLEERFVSMAPDVKTANGVVVAASMHKAITRAVKELDTAPTIVSVAAPPKRKIRRPPSKATSPGADETRRRPTRRRPGTPSTDE